ncbi:MAG TPA: DinB family protein [Blastocatellia bacterium]|nr:DinB family protein [Blastocatellia bacterium]
MKMTTHFLSELDREVERSRRALEQVPEGKYQWKPHDKSMIFGYLSDMISTMPSWLAMAIQRDELDIAPKDGSTMRQAPKETSAALLEALEKSAAEAKSALEDTSDEHLITPWRLLAGGQVVMEAPRHVVIQDTFNHWAHHRGQMTVYLRLMGAKVPALYGPSADDNRFE